MVLLAGLVAWVAWVKFVKFVSLVAIITPKLLLHFHSHTSPAFSIATKEICKGDFPVCFGCVGWASCVGLVGCVVCSNQRLRVRCTRL